MRNRAILASLALAGSLLMAGGAQAHDNWGRPVVYGAAYNPQNPFGAYSPPATGHYYTPPHSVQPQYQYGPNQYYGGHHYGRGHHHHHRHHHHDNWGRYDARGYRW